MFYTYRSFVKLLTYKGHLTAIFEHSKSSLITLLHYYYLTLFSGLARMDGPIRMFMLFLRLRAWKGLKDEVVFDLNQFDFNISYFVFHTRVMYRVILQQIFGAGMVYTSVCKQHWKYWEVILVLKQLLIRVIHEFGHSFQGSQQ